MCTQHWLKCVSARHKFAQCSWLPASAPASPGAVIAPAAEHATRRRAWRRWAQLQAAGSAASGCRSAHLLATPAGRSKHCWQLASILGCLRASAEAARCGAAGGTQLRITLANHARLPLPSRCLGTLCTGSAQCARQGDEVMSCHGPDSQSLSLRMPLHALSSSDQNRLDTDISASSRAGDGKLSISGGAWRLLVRRQAMSPLSSRRSRLLGALAVAGATGTAAYTWYVLRLALPALSAL
jgi:hypothetical protein